MRKSWIQSQSEVFRPRPVSLLVYLVGTITERCGCLQSAVSKHIKCKVDWKEEFG